MPLGLLQNNNFTQFTMDVWNDKIFYQEKEFPAGFMAASILNVPEEEHPNVLVVEDAVNGVEAALAAGMRCLAVPDPNLLALNKPIFARADQLLSSLTEFDPSFWGLPSFTL